MKKVFLLGLLLCSVIGMNAQVRIGGDTIPHAAAILDLNANNDSLPAGNKGGLALPRVSLAGNTAQLNNTVPANGMMVYNTGGALEAGIYYWNGTQWMKETENSTAEILAPLITWISTRTYRASSSTWFVSTPTFTGISVFGTDTCILLVGSVDAVFWMLPGTKKPLPLKVTILPPSWDLGMPIPAEFNRNNVFLASKNMQIYGRSGANSVSSNGFAEDGVIFLPYLYWQKAAIPGYPGIEWW